MPLPQVPVFSIFGGKTLQAVIVGVTLNLGADDGNSRHVNRALVRLIVELFVEAFGDRDLKRQITVEPENVLPAYC